MKNARLLALGAGAALLPFAVVAFFTWARTGRPAGVVELCGRGELLPAAALLSAQAIGVLYGAPVPRRTPGWSVAIGIAWFVLAVSSAGYTVPFADATDAGARIAWMSLVFFGAGAGLRLTVSRWEEPP